MQNPCTVTRHTSQQLSGAAASAAASFDADDVVSIAVDMGVWLSSSSLLLLLLLLSSV